MALNIKNSEVERMAHELAAATGESLTAAVRTALRERLVAVTRPPERAILLEEVAQLQAFVASLPDRDARAPDEILGYDDHGLPR
jgi:antitoxin VapB